MIYDSDNIIHTGDMNDIIVSVIMCTIPVKFYTIYMNDPYQHCIKQVRKLIQINYFLKSSASKKHQLN